VQVSISRLFWLTDDPKRRTVTTHFGLNFGLTLARGQSAGMTSQLVAELA